MWLYRGHFPCFILASTGWATVAHRWQCHGTGAASTLLLSCCHFFRGSSLVRPLRFRCGTVVVRLLIRAAAPLFYGCCICCIFAAFSPLQPLFYRRPIRPIFGRSRGRQTSYSPNTYSSRNLPVSVPHPCRWHGKGDFGPLSRSLCHGWVRW